MSWVVYIIPGFDQFTEARGYRAIAAKFKATGARVIIVTINWKYQTVTSYTRKLLKQIYHPEEKTICLFGFSMGAMVALLIARKLEINCLMLCSMSPYFRENLHKMNSDDQTSLGVRRLRDFERYTFRRIASQMSGRILIVVGDMESRGVIRMSAKAKREIKTAEIIHIRNGIHSLSQPEYAKKLEELIKKEFGRSRLRGI